MLTENNFAAALKLMGFVEKSKGVYEKIFAENISMSANLNEKKIFFPAQIEGRDRIKFFNESLRENLVVFECVNRLLDKGYRPEHIELEKFWKLGHEQKGGRADIVVSAPNGDTLFIVECKTFGHEFNHELENLNLDGGQLFSYRQQEHSCQWLVLYASTLADDEIIFQSASVSCREEIYQTSKDVKDFFRMWRDFFQKKIVGDVIFHDETVAYKIGVKPLRKKNLLEFNDTKIVNQLEEILRHNNISDKSTAFNRLIALLICKLADEIHKDDDQEVDFQFKFGTDTHETFQDRLQSLYHQGMEEFMREPITYVPLAEIDELFFQAQSESRDVLKSLVKEKFRMQKFFTNNDFAFTEVHNEELFYKNGKILVEVVNIFKDYRIIGAKNLQILGDLFEQLLDKGFKQDAGIFFTPLPITGFIWDSLPLEKIISVEKNFVPPKIIDYACGAGHFLTQGYEAVNDFFTRNNIEPPKFWEDEKLFGVEKDYRLARVSKVSLFMHGADKGKIKFGDGLENYFDEGVTPGTFDILVSNPPYAIKNFSQHLNLKNNSFDTLKKISNEGSEIETLFVERIAQLLKAGGIAAVILPGSILNKDGKSFVSAREKILQNFYVRAIAEFGSKTFSATGTKTNILFLQKISDPPEKFQLFADTVNGIFNSDFNSAWDNEKIFVAWLNKINVDADTYKKFIRREVDYTHWQDDKYFGEYFSAFVDKVTPPKNFKSDDEKIAWLNQRFYDFAQKIECEKIQYFAQTFTQTTLIISAPEDNKEQEIFLGYSWSNRKGNEGIKIKSAGGLLYDPNDRRADNKLAAAVRKSFYGEKFSVPDAQNFYYYLNLADMIDFSGVNFTKTIRLTKKVEVTYSGKYPLEKLGNVAPYVTERTTLDEINIADYVTTDNMLKNKHGIKIYEGEPQISSLTKYLKFDILVSNIRPYLKKIWLADRDGGCSNDVLVFRSFDENLLLPKYLFLVLSQDYFFDFMMLTTKGLKMPRGDKNNVLTFDVPVPPLEEQKKIVEEFRAIDEEISAQEKIIAACDEDVKEKFAEMFGPYSSKKDCKFLNLCSDDTSNGIKIPAENYLPEGDVPIIDQSVNEIAGYSKLNAPPYENLPCIIFGDHTEIFKYETEKFYMGADGVKIIIPTDRNQLNVLFLLYMLKIEYKPTGGYSRHFKNLGSAKFYLPPLELQEKFAEYVRENEAKKKSAQVRVEELKAAREELVVKYFR